jgi:hypothetical protein
MESCGSLQTSFYPMKFVQDGATRLLEVKDMPEGVAALPREQARHQGDRISRHDEGTGAKSL